jgi:transcriptional regulator GlxA family with amidase domain
VDSRTLEALRLPSDNEREGVERAEQFLRARLPPRDDTVARVQRLIASIAENPELTTVDALVASCGLGKRALQRLFSQYVGVGPKWVIRRFRLHEAAEQLEHGRAPNLAALAASLGYFDQAHFIKDFKALVGKAPADYVRSLDAP